MNQPRPKPVGEFVFGQITGGEREERDNDFSVAGVKRIAVEHEESFANDRCRSLVAIHKRMVARDSKSISCRQRRRIGLAISRQIRCTRHCTVKQALIANAFATAMFGQLFTVCRQRDIGRDPNPVSHPNLFGEFAKCELAPCHNVARRRHLRFKIGTVRG